MRAIDLVEVEVACDLSQSMRARQVASMFDVPMEPRSVIRWSGHAPLHERVWSVGLIVGPSGSGKSTLARAMFGAQPSPRWEAGAIVDDFPAEMPLQRITDALSAVGLNTIPAWLRPHGVLSTGEQFRADVARALCGDADPIVIDEFTSTVDRQVARIASHAVQKSVRRSGRRLVAVTCHYDVVDWLQPDWTLEPATMTFAWRELQQRPRLHGHVARVPYSEWARFAPYHYLTADLNRAARCFGLYVEGVPHPVAFAGMLFRVHPRVRDIYGCSRLVTLPDWQGLGLAFRLMDVLGAAFGAIGYRVHCYPAHPPFIRAFDRAEDWGLEKAPGLHSPHVGASSERPTMRHGRPCAVFRYAGPIEADRDVAAAFLGIGAAKASGKRTGKRRNGEL